MAKQRRENDFIDEPKAQAGLVEIPPGLVDVPHTTEYVADPEKGAMAARIAELESLLARREAATEAAVEDVQPATMRYWKVALENAPTHVVRAVDQANAWLTYKREMGVIGSQFEPEVTGSNREAYRKAQAKRHNCRPEEFPLPDE